MVDCIAPTLSIYVIVSSVGEYIVDFIGAFTVNASATLLASNVIATITVNRSTGRLKGSSFSYLEGKAIPSLHWLYLASIIAGVLGKCNGPTGCSLHKLIST